MRILALILKRLQVFLLILIFAAGIRLWLIYRARHAPIVPRNHAADSVTLDADDYVVPKKLHAFDLASVRALVGTTVWIQTGYAIAYYPYNAATHKANFTHEAGTLPPLEKLQIAAVVLNPTPASPGRQQVLAAFRDGASWFAFPIGVVKNGSYTFFTDQMLFLEDPHELYKHWSVTTWQAIERHEVTLGMSPLQTAFAIGVGIPQDSSQQKLRYANGGKPLFVDYERGKVVSFRSAQ